MKTGSQKDEYRRQEYWSCGRKAKYTSRGGAVKAARRAALLFEKVFKIVRCKKYCGFFHIVSVKGVVYRGPPGREEHEMRAPGAEREEELRASTREVVRRLDERRRGMSIEMVPVKSSNVRAVGLDGERLLVQFDGGIYECVYKGQAGTSTVEGRAAWVKGVYERFLASDSKGRFYNEQIRRQGDVWRVRELNLGLMARVEAGGRVTIESEQIDEPKAGGTEKFLRDEKRRTREWIEGGDFSRPPELARHGFTYGSPTEGGTHADRCRGCGLPREHEIHYQEPAQVSQPATHESLRPRELAEKGYRGTRRLILLVGLPRSGKSSWARMTGFPVVSPDAIRLALHGRAYEQLAEPFVWAQTRLMVRSLFLAGHETVVLDACNVTRARRDEWRCAEWETVCQVFEESREECLRRAYNDPPAATPSNDWVEEHAALLDAIDRMAKNWEPLGDDEPRYEGLRLDLSPPAVAAFDPKNLTAAGLAFLEQEMYLKTGVPRDAASALADDAKPKE